MAEISGTILVGVADMKLILIPLLIVLLSSVLFLNFAVPQQRAAQKDLATLVKDDNEFAFNLYAKLRDQEGNVFFSPDSISTALGMTYAGARGTTAEEMAKTLHFTLDRDRLDHAFHTLLAQRNGETKKRGYELHAANALWGQKDFGFLPAYLKLMQVDFGAELRQLDFRADPELARQTINAWVEQQTKDRIKELLKPSMVRSDSRLVLTNAIYFKGDWDLQFRKDFTRPEPFQTLADKRQDVPMMHQTSHFKYLDSATFQALELPYKGKELSMVVLLPKKPNGLAELEKKLTAANLAHVLGQMKMEEVVLSLPKFKATCEYDLGGTLGAMGMPLAFSPEADFSGMNGERNLFIGTVVHKAFVDVNEEGTEAAAATGVVMRLAAAPVRNEFRADHPFVFLIRDTRSGSILFLGRLANP
jgi:serpin B